MTKLFLKINDSIRKNKEDIKGILLKKYPDFIFKGSSGLKFGEIPAFVFHSVVPENFEKQLKYLYDNNYTTIDADTLINVITGKAELIERAVVLTFDDGLSNLWTTIFPLLKKYNFVGVSFICPSFIEEKNEIFPNIEDVWSGKVLMKDITERERTLPFCTWEEIKKIHNSGVIDFQSHSFSHSSVFTNDKIFDFINPGFQSSPLVGTLNLLVKMDGFEKLLNGLEWGLPIYKWDSNISATKRYMEDENVSKICVEYVKSNGGINFFKKKFWKRELKKVWKDALLKCGKNGSFQNPNDRYKDIEKELSKSKNEIETRLNKNVYHLSNPWYKGSDLSVQISEKLGYKSNFWGMVQGRAINMVGEDPFYIKRIDENYIFSLPGKNRKSLFEIHKDKFVAQLLGK